MKPTLIDSGFLYSLYSKGDVNFERSRLVANAGGFKPLVPEVVITEVAYLFRHRRSIDAAIEFLEIYSTTGLTTISLSPTDYHRVAAIMRTYKDAELDFVDCAIMALAERLNVTHICTYDRCDFSLFRPRHCDYLTLLPE